MGARFSPIGVIAAATAALLLLGIPTAATATTLRWSNDSDAGTLDPHALRESFTEAFQQNTYETLARYTGDLKIEPCLAVSWTVEEPTRWRFKLRQGVRFQNGAPFTADDVVFSFERAMADKSPFKGGLATVRQVRKVDDYTVDIVTVAPHPILIRDLTNVGIMNRAWAVANGAQDASNPSAKYENYATRNAMGTGPFIVKSREADSRTVLVPNPNWWDQPQHNLTEVVFTPIAADATRTAAMLGGQLDVLQSVPPQAIQVLQKAPGIRVLEGPELRIVILGMDQRRNELLESNVKGKNPFKDIKIRRAFYQAIDVEAIRARVMRGTSVPMALMVAPEVSGFDGALNTRYPHDPEAARTLLAEGGYPSGFELGMDCPNDRYVNDEEICKAVAAMLARVGVKVSLRAQSKATYFKKILSGDTTFYMVGWASLPTADSHNLLVNLVHTPSEKLGTWNVGGYSNKRVDELIGQIQSEIDPKKRQAMISEAFRIHKEEFGHIPLHQQSLAWAVRENVQLIQSPDGILRLRYVRVR